MPTRSDSHRPSSRPSEFSLEHFRQDDVRNLEVIGEAAKKLPEDTRRDIDVDWKRIAAPRDVLIHENFGIDAEIYLGHRSDKSPGALPESFFVPE